MSSQPRPPTLALVCASIHTGASRGLWTGLVEEALARGARVLILPGGRLGAAEAWEASRNLNYGLASSRNASGIVSWTTSLSGSAAAGMVEAFVASLAGLPLVTVSEAAAGAPLVAFDAYRGMRSMVEHLVDAHGHKHIAFIRGPSSHVSAEQRYRAYRDALESRGLVFRPEFVTPPLAWDSGHEAPRLLLEEAGLVPGKDFTALVAASDLLAFWAMEGFLARGWRIPEDLALAGFNDSLESTLASPALSTVAVDFEREGGVAADILLRLLSGELVPPSTLLPAELRLRRSCGCPGLVPESPGDGARAGQGLPAAGPGRRAFLGEMAALLGADPLRSGPWLEDLLDSLVLELGGETGDRETSPFLGALELALDRTSPEGLEPGGWQPLLSLLRRRALAKKGALSPGLEEIFHRGRGLAFEASRRALTRNQWLAEQKALELRRAGAALLLCHDLPSLVVCLGEALPRLGIPRAWLALTQGQDSRLCLVAALGEGAPSMPEGGLAFDAADTLPPGLLPSQGAFVVEPLFFREENLGRLVLEIGPRDGGIYEELRSYLSSALKSAKLFGQAEEARGRAEAADLVKTRLMASVSRGMGEPLARIVAEAELHGSPGISHEAAGLLTLIEDLLDLSRADLGELIPSFGLVDLRDLLAEAGVQDLGPDMGTELRLPLILADRPRLLRVLRNLLGVPPAQGFTLRARLEKDLILITGRGLGGAIPDLALARRILGLHGGGLQLQDGGSGFVVSLPLPTALGGPPQSLGPGRVWDLAQGLPIEGGEAPGMLALDLETEGAWTLARDLRRRPELSSLPLAVYPPRDLPPPKALSAGTSFLDHLEAAWPEAASPPILIVASSSGEGAELRDLARAGLPGRLSLSLGSRQAGPAYGGTEPGLVLADARAAIAWLGQEGPSRKPGPLVLVFCSELCPPEELLGQPRIFVVPRDVLPRVSLVRLIGTLGEGRLALSPAACLLVQKAQVWLAEAYASPCSRADLALALGVNGDYLGRLFRGLWGLSPWEYLGRCRVRQAQILLKEAHPSLAELGQRVGFRDQAYFSRVFRKFSGLGPREWEQQS